MRWRIWDFVARTLHFNENCSLFKIKSTKKIDVVLGISKSGELLIEYKT
jgi:hypothetical protein